MAALLFALLVCSLGDTVVSLRTAEAKEGRTAGLNPLLSRRASRPSVPELLENGTLRVKLQRRPARNIRGGQLRGAHLPRQSFMQLGAEAKAKTVFSQPSEIFGTILVGSPPMEYMVTFDTASGNLMLPSSKCTGVACLSHQPYDEALSATSKPIFMLDDPAENGQREQVKLHVGRGLVTGELIRDQVCLTKQLSVCAKTAFISAVEMSDEPFLLFPYDGILGLGMPALSIQKRFNLMGNLADVGSLKRNLFAIWLAETGDEEDSEITFGSLDGDRLGSNVMWLPVSTIATGLWQVTVKDVLIGKARLGICNGKKQCQVAFDSGTNAITGPSAIISQLEAEVNVKEDCTNYDKLPSLGFDFGEYVLTLEHKDYVMRTSGTSCHHEFFGLDLPPPKGPIFLLGEPFLKRYYTIYDRTSMRVGIGLAKHKTPSAVKDETIEEAAERLMIPQTHPDET
mmetsp:Transcript_70892/g.122834  ORF Transcript_70892/g.122834 Transcript_70892/m.122834 type:complete len:455 (+) Transcript_70892:145-1509(+)